MKKTLKAIIALTLLFAVCLGTSSCVVKKSSVTEIPSENYIFALVNQSQGSEKPYSGLELLCRVNTATGNAIPVCDRPACSHRTGDCPANNLIFYDRSEDGKTLGFVSFSEGEAGKSNETIYRYDTETFELSVIETRPYANEQMTFAVLNDRIIFNEIEVIERNDPDDEIDARADRGYDYISRTYAVLNNGTKKLLLEEKNVYRSLEVCGDRLIVLSSTIEDGKHMRLYEIYDRDMVFIKSTTDSSVAFDKEGYVEMEDPDSPTGYKKYLKVFTGELIYPCEGFSPFVTLDDYVLFTDRSFLNKKKYTEEDEINSRMVYYAASRDTGAIKKVLDIREKYQEYGIDYLTNITFYRFQFMGGPKSGNCILMNVNGYCDAKEEYSGREIRRPLKVHIIINCDTGEVIKVD